MKQIIIKELHFVNFKGFRNKTIEFNEKLTNICGRNGLGKTSIFDGFTWLLFGKDSQDRKTFDLKTLSSNGVAIPKQPHEVSAVLIVDGEVIELCRRFNEKWVKRRGQSEEEFTGHEEERLYNNVPLSLKEWNEKISAICSEQVFKFITNPNYFVSQKPDVQRNMLFRMAGEISDSEIASGNTDFTALLASLTGKSMEEYKREIQAKKRKIKAEIDTIPDRIDERKRDVAMLSGYNFDELEEYLAENQKHLAQVEDVILDHSKMNENIIKEREELIKKLGKLKEEKLRIEFTIKEEVSADYRKAISAKNEIISKIRELETTISNLEARIVGYSNTITACNSTREKLLAEWQSINAERISFSESDFICPTCKRQYEIDEIESKQQEMTENFNANKADRLKENNRKGQENKRKIEENNLAIKQCEQDVELAKKEILSLENSEAYKIEPVAPDAQPTIEANADWQRVVTEIEAIENSLNEEKASQQETINHSEIRKQIISEIDMLKKTLSSRETIKRNNERIAELEKQLKQGAQEVAELECIEFTITDFNKARIEAIDSRINGLFSLVKFKMFEQQINGGEIETCEAIVNGVPYSSQNRAMQVNMGLDIINAICKFEGITAPIFIDNAESVNNLLESDSQVIRLVVTEDSDLIIK